MKLQTATCEVKDHIALVTMGNPPVNAQNLQFHKDMMLVFDTLGDREDVRGCGQGLFRGRRHQRPGGPRAGARRMMFTGYRVPAEELFRMGVVEACVPPDKLMDTVMALAKEIAAKSPVAIGLAKHALNTIEEMSLRDGYRFEKNMTTELSKFEDSREAMLAWAEKRAPVIKGK